ncbi:MAG: TM2 domain-containing protein [Phycicoccus sp.]|nr:TM2 domain-containing protein [Phycicoccus sp.]
MEVLGAHQLYMRNYGRAIGYLLTIGRLSVGWAIDLFTLPSQISQVNAQIIAGVR